MHTQQKQRTRSSDKKLIDASRKTGLNALYITGVEEKLKALIEQ